MVTLIDLPGEVLSLITDHTLKDIRFRPNQRGGHRRNLPKALSILLVTKKNGLHDAAKKSLLDQGLFTIKSISEYRAFEQSHLFTDANQISAIRIDLHLDHEVPDIFAPEIIPNFANLGYINLARLYCSCWRSRSVEHVFASGLVAPGNPWESHSCTTLEGLIRSHLFENHQLPINDAAAMARFNKIEINVDNVLLYCRTSIRHHIQDYQVRCESFKSLPS